jgi:hypothetical protein
VRILHPIVGRKKMQKPIVLIVASIFVKIHETSKCIQEECVMATPLYLGLVLVAVAYMLYKPAKWYKKVTDGKASNLYQRETLITIVVFPNRRVAERLSQMFRLLAGAFAFFAVVLFIMALASALS